MTPTVKTKTTRTGHVRASSYTGSTRYMWKDQLSNEDNHRMAAESHAMERFGMGHGARGELAIDFHGKAYTWTVVEYSNDEDERHPDDDEHLPQCSGPRNHVGSCDRFCQ